MFPNVFTPRVDGIFIPDEPIVLMKEGKFNDVDIITGVNRDEGATMALFFFPHLDDYINENLLSLAPYVTQYFDEDEKNLITNKLLNYFLNGKQIGTKSIEETIKLMTTTFFTHSHDLTSYYATEHSKEKQKNTFLYELNHRGEFCFCDTFSAPYDTKNWIGHVDDLYYLFNLEIKSPPMNMTRPGDIKVRQNMLKMWTNFASTGNPTPDESLGFIWKTSAINSLDHLSIVLEPFMEQDSRIEVREFMNTLPTRQNKILNNLKDDQMQDNLSGKKTEL